MVSVIWALGVSILSFFWSMLLVSGQSGGVARSVILNSDPQIVYEPEYCTSTSVFECMGAWWDTTLNDGTVIKTTAGPSSQYRNAQNTLSYSFYGSSLELHGLLDAFGANMIVQIDNMFQMVNTSTGTGGGSEQPSILGNYTNLDPQVIHTLSIGWCANYVPDASTGVPNPLSYAYFDHLVIDNFRKVDGTSSSSGSTTSNGPTPTPSSTLSSTPSRSTKLSSGAIAGLVVALVLFVALFIASSFFILRNRRRAPWWRRSNSQHVRVMIESYEDRGSDRSSSPVSAWKARPHLSLPPATLPPAYAHSDIGTSEGAEFGDIKGESYLDLESGSSKSMLDDLSSSEGDLRSSQDNQKARLSFHRNPLSPVHSPRMSYPPRVKLRINTRESALAPRNDPFARYSTAPSRGERTEEQLPQTPYTSYVVETATVARTLSAQVVSKASLSCGEGSTSTQTSMPPLPPLPPVPTPSTKEKRRRTKVRSGASFYRSRATPRAHRLETADAQVSDSLRQIPNPYDSGINLESGNARPSLDAMSIMTRSVPPPYALHM